MVQQLPNWAGRNVDDGDDASFGRGGRRASVWCLTLFSSGRVAWGAILRAMYIGGAGSVTGGGRRQQQQQVRTGLGQIGQKGRPWGRRRVGSSGEGRALGVRGEAPHLRW